MRLSHKQHVLRQIEEQLGEYLAERQDDERSAELIVMAQGGVVLAQLALHQLADRQDELKQAAPA